MIWFSVCVGGQRWTAHLVPAGDPRLGADCYGRAHLAKGEIYLERGMSQSVTESYAVHELFLHAVLNVSGATHAMGNSEEVEETVTRTVTPVMHRLLLDLGFKFPKVPK